MILNKRFLMNNRKTITGFILITGLSVSLNFGCESKTKNVRAELKDSIQKYSTYDSFEEMLKATDTKYFTPVRISPVGTKKKPMYHGFFYYNHTQSECLQFEPTGRYLLALRIFIEGREVQPFDKGEIGMFDLKNNNKWIKIGETTAWNWQQGCRLQWVPGFEEIAWNDRSEDGKTFVTRLYNVITKTTRTLPFAVYSISPDGKTALCVNFERIWHRGCKYEGIPDPYRNVWAPGKIGLWKMDMKSGELKLIKPLSEIAKIMYPEGFSPDTVYKNLYFFRAGYNPSGTRIFAFVKDYKNKCGVTETRTDGYTMNLDGKDVRFFYKEPSHHFWFNDEELVDNGTHLAPDGKTYLGYFRFKDDGTGVAKEKIFDAPNGHITVSRNGEWILTDASDGDGYLYLYMYHIPTKKIIPLAKLETQIGGYMYRTGLGALRVDLHPRFSHDEKIISFDSSHGGVGRQIYIMDISQIINNPPESQTPDIITPGGKVSDAEHYLTGNVSEQVNYVRQDGTYQPATSGTFFGNIPVLKYR